MTTKNTPTPAQRRAIIAAITQNGGRVEPWRDIRVRTALSKQGWSKLGLRGRWQITPLGYAVVMSYYRRRKLGAMSEEFEAAWTRIIKRHHEQQTLQGGAAVAPEP